jgi:type II secretory pathway pseudopilin PulG
MYRCKNDNESIVVVVVVVVVAAAALLSYYRKSKLFINSYVKHYAMGFTY